MNKQVQLEIFRNYSVQKQAEKLAEELMSDRDVDTSVIDHQKASVVVGRKLYFYLQVSVIPLFSIGLLSIAEPTRRLTLTKRVLFGLGGNAPIFLYCRQSYLSHYNQLKENLKKKYLLKGEEKIYK